MHGQSPEQQALTDLEQTLACCIQIFRQIWDCCFDEQSVSSSLPDLEDLATAPAIRDKLYKDQVYLSS